MPEWNQRQVFLHLARVHPACLARALVSKARSELALVGSERFHALAENHKGFVDIAGFLQSLSSGMSVLRSLRASKVNKG